jgi:hypothetical protein
MNEPEDSMRFLQRIENIELNLDRCKYNGMMKKVGKGQCGYLKSYSLQECQRCLMDCRHWLVHKRFLSYSKDTLDGAFESAMRRMCTTRTDA